MKTGLVLWILCIGVAGLNSAEKEIKNMPKCLVCQVDKAVAQVDAKDLALTVNSLTEMEDDAILMQHNERGIYYLLSGDYDKAILDFNFILSSLTANRTPLNKTLFASALWGRLLSYAYKDCVIEAMNDLRLFRICFLHQECNSCSIYGARNYVDNASDFIKLTADFANPNEKLSPEECQERVRGTMQLIRVLTLKIRDNALAGLINMVVSEIEHFANNCCERAHWTECLDPVIDAWQYLKKCMDKGVAISPQALLPRR